MSFPRAVATCGRGRGGSGTAAAANTGNERVSKTLDTIVEIGEALGVPFGAVGTGNGLGSRESEIEDVILVMAAISVDARTVTRGSQRD